MNVLLIGQGGREHALAWKIRQSPLLGELYIAPGNAGMDELGKRVKVDIQDASAVAGVCEKRGIDLVVIGPEGPLVGGVADDLRETGVAVFGPGAEAAKLEGSKQFTKEICRQVGIPTAEFECFDERAAAENYAREKNGRVVVKYDGLAAGKGVTVCGSVEEAVEAIRGCFEEKNAKVVIEDILVGEEASLFFLTDGETILPFGCAQDHKRAFDGDKGPNTGGMGAYSPASVVSEKVWRETVETIARPAIDEMRKRGTPYQGVLYVGVMIENEMPSLVEFNVRFGDPECQVLMARLESDLLELLHACAVGELAEKKAVWREECAMTVVMASKGYPGDYEKGTVIEGVERAEDSARIFHAGTEKREGKLVAVGGRVLNVTAMGEGIEQARRKAYEAIEKIEWENGFCRKDIGWREIERRERAR